MKKEIEFKFAGMQFMVELDVSMGDTLKDSVIESVMGVYIWNKDTKKYEKVHALLDEFERDMQDQINDAFEDLYNDEKALYEEMAFEAYREQQYEMEHNK